MIRIREVSIDGEIIGKVIERSKSHLLRQHNRLAMHIDNRNGQPGIGVTLKKVGDASRYMPEGASLGDWVILKSDV